MCNNSTLIIIKKNFKCKHKNTKWCTGIRQWVKTNEFFPKKRCSLKMISEITTRLNRRWTTGLSVGLAYCVFFPQPQGCSLPFLLVSASFITRKGKERKFLSQFCSSLATLWRHFAERGWNGITQVEDSEPAVIRMIWVFSLSDRLILDIEAWPDDENKHKFEKPKPTNQCGPVLRWSFHLTLLRFQPWFHWGIKANDILSVVVLSLIGVPLLILVWNGLFLTTGCF